MTTPAPATPLLIQTLNDCQGTTDDNNREWWRWHFAGLALQGLLASPDGADSPPAVFAEYACRHAGAMVAELERTARTEPREDPLRRAAEYGYEER